MRNFLPRIAVVRTAFPHTLRRLKLVYTSLLIVAVLGIETVLGGTRLIHSLPAFAVIAVAALLSLASLRQPIARPSGACLTVTALFFTYILARAAYSPVPYLAWPDFYMVIACLSVYLLTALYLTQTRLRTAVIVALLALAVVELFIGLRQFRLADEWMPFGFIRSPYGSRASGTFISSITLAGYLEVVGIFALSLAVWAQWPGWARIGLAYGALCCYAGVAITGSRGGYVSSAASLVALAVLTIWVRSRVNPGRFLRTTAITVVLLAVGVGVSIFLMQKSALLQQRLAMIGSHDVRWYNWLAAIDQWRLSPWFGTGAGTHLYFGRFFRRIQIQADPEHAHSDYLELLSEYGLIGFCGMVAFLFIHLHHSFRAVGVVVKKAPGDPYLPFRDNRLAFQIGALTAISAYLVHSITDFNLHIPGHALIFAFIFGLTANPVTETPPSTAEPRGFLLARLALPALGLWMLISGVAKLPGEYWAEKARVALRNRQYEDSLAFSARALAVEQRNPFVFAYVGQARRLLAEQMPIRVLREPGLRASIAAYRNAIRLFPQEESFWVRMAQACDLLGDYREARTAYTTALYLDPNLMVIHSYYAAHLRATGEPDLAEAQLRRAAEISAGTVPSSAPIAPSPDALSQ